MRDFRVSSNTETWYDVFEDWSLIEASFSMQYGIRLRHEDDMPWGEFTTLLSGLNGDTPLGAIASIRSENSSEKLKNFSPEQRRIRSEYRKKRAREKIETDPESAKQQIRDLQKSFSLAFGKGGK